MSAQEILVELGRTPETISLMERPEVLELTIVPGSSWPLRF